ncbi:MAG: S-layer homology domain-containing protein [Tissierellia bacterium]|nr:S-layer homology domain-containing protein [Tissierellia bacterium]
MKIKKKMGILALACLLIFSHGTLVFGVSFWDVGGHWASGDIYALSQAGIIRGYRDGSFRPEGSMSKVEFYAMVNRAADLRASYPVTFKDVHPGDWYYQEVAKAIKAGYLTPTTGRLYPRAPISRQEAARILGYMYGLRGSTGSLNAFYDQGSISPGARPAVGKLVDLGIIRGYPDGAFRPQGSVSRAEVAKIFNQLRIRFGNPPRRQVHDTHIQFG